MTGSFGNQAGKFRSQKIPVKVVKVEEVDLATGEPKEPPEYLYYVVTLDNPPNVVTVAATVEEAVAWVDANPTYELVATPAPS